ncbi:MAG: DUF1553 domain-containing protein, partial [Pirellulales bacterium]|nr:DUF1553 domain-containing protein [Pirellulales bacterium]
GFVEPGDTSSHLLSVLSEIDGQRPTMPKDADPLSAQQVDVITRWIQAGAPWTEGVPIESKVSDFDWWSLKPIERPPVPDVGSDWIRTPIDAFILAGLNEQGLQPSPEADRRTLIRRLTYDLIGLPPTPAEIEAFLQDQDPRAYEKLVDRLLESKHYGERWARHWLDVVKYADTCGYDKDKLRANAWPYRDYVIRSLNEDKPYSRFVQEQIAGDVLFPGDRDGILGLGFIAAGPWDFIGHVEVPESKIDGKVARNLDRDEMVTNTLNTFCSVTIQCARCHHHKFDPFTQEHYYSLQAIFSAVDRAERPYDLDPAIERQRRDLESKLAGLRQRKQAIDREIADAGGARLVALKQEIAQLKQQLAVTKEPAFGYHSAIEQNQQVEKWVQVDLGREVPISTIVLRPCHDDFAGIGAGFGFPVRFAVEVSSHPFSGEEPSTRVAAFDEQDFPNPGLTPLELGGIDLPARYVRVRATRLAKRNQDFIFALAELQVMDQAGNNVCDQAKVSSLDSIEAPVRWSRKNLIDGVWAQAGDAKISRRLAEAENERAAIVARIETEDRRSRLSKVEQEISKTEKQLQSLPVGKMVYAAATDFTPQGNFKPTKGKSREVHLLHRGDVQQPKQRLGPGLLPLGSDDRWQLDSNASEADRRRTLAGWLVREDHPLVWRSIVNRVWQYHFGIGLVETPNDFGRMGAQPSHPRLLDWLACEFRDRGQSLKQLHRLMVTSSVYRQSSAFDAAAAAKDGSNRYLWRMSRRRLEAEEIRDSILAVSGRLDRRMGGPGFYLFKLEKTTHSPHYQYHKFDPADPASHRRSIYRFIVRSQPDPFMTTLDCADSSQSTPRRDETLTSLQALSLLNNRFNLEMARQFAGRLRNETASLSGQVDRAMALTIGRLPTADEHRQLASYAEKHGLENLCRMMFNLSEFVFVD